jgi:membrane protein
MAAGSLSRLKRLQAEALALWDEKWVGTGQHEDFSWWQRLVRFCLFVGRSFVRNRCPIRASSLAYTTLLALVPLLAVAISISTGLLKSDKGREQVSVWVNTIVTRFAPQLGVEGSSVNAAQVVEKINASIQNVQSGTLGVTATILLVFVAISLLASIEATMNDIWGVARGRSWFSRVIYYWAVITLGPILILVAMGLGVGPQFLTMQQLLNELPWVTKYIYPLLPMFVLTFTFAMFYFLMPNTKVEWRAALIGGAVAGSLLYLNNKFNAIYFSQVVGNSKIYGSLGSLPVFLVGLYFSWLILLFGAQVSYAFQNRRSYFQEKHAENINQRGREFVALRIMTMIAHRFHVGDRPPTICEIADALSIPSRLVSIMIAALQQTRLLVEARLTKAGDCAYVPARPLEDISVQNLMDALRAGIGQDVATHDDPVRHRLREELGRIQNSERSVAGKITLRDLVQETLPIATRALETK